MSTPAPTGRRERKKAATRQAIADAALRLFLERGYDRVSIREIADAADVSTTTLFKHFSGKEALVFDEQGDMEAALLAAVTNRPAGQGIVEALHRFVRSGRTADPAQAPDLERFSALVESTPALRLYAERVWARHADALARVIAQECGREADDVSCAALARFALDVPGLVRGRTDPVAAVDEAFALLAEGFAADRCGG